MWLLLEMKFHLYLLIFFYFRFFVLFTLASLFVRCVTHTCACWVAAAFRWLSVSFFSCVPFAFDCQRRFICGFASPTGRPTRAAPCFQPCQQASKESPKSSLVFALGNQTNKRANKQQTRAIF